MQGRISPRPQHPSGSQARPGAATGLPDPVWFPGDPRPLHARVPIALTWISFPAKRSCRGSLPLAPQLSPGPENTEHGVVQGVHPHLPQLRLPPQPGAGSQSFTPSLSPPAMTTVLRATRGGGDAPSPSSPPKPAPPAWPMVLSATTAVAAALARLPGVGVRAEGRCPQHQLYLLPGGVPRLLVRRHPARPDGT